MATVHTGSIGFPVTRYARKVATSAGNTCEPHASAITPNAPRLFSRNGGREYSENAAQDPRYVPTRRTSSLQRKLKKTAAQSGDARSAVICQTGRPAMRLALPAR